MPPGVLISMTFDLNILVEPKGIGPLLRPVEKSTDFPLGGGLLFILECVVISV